MVPHIEKIEYKSYTWIDVIEPNEAVIKDLAKKYKFHELDVEDVLSETQRSKIDDYDGYIFLVLHFPYFDKKSGGVKVEEVNLFLSPNYCITLHDGNLGFLKEFVNDCKTDPKKKDEIMGKGTGFLLYELLDRLFEVQFPLIDKMERRMHAIERDVFDLGKGQKDMLKEILHLKKDIILLERTTSPLRVVIPQLEYKNDKLIDKGLEIYFDDIVDKVEKIWSLLVNQKEMVELLQDTNESVISHTTNNVIKILTFFSVIMLPINFLASFFGMNVIFPRGLGEHELGYIWISVGMIVVTLCMLLFFRLKRWI